MNLLIKTYSESTEDQKELLKVFALCDEDVNKTNFVDFLRKSNIRNIDDRNYYVKLFNDTLKEAFDSRLIFDGTPLQIPNKEFKKFLFEEAFKDKKIITHIENIRRFFPTNEVSYYSNNKHVLSRLLREIKYSLYLADKDNFLENYSIIKKLISYNELSDELKKIIYNNSELLQKQDHEVQLEIIIHIVYGNLKNFEFIDDYIPTLQNIVKNGEGRNKISTENILVNIYIFQGKLKDAQKIINKYPDNYYFLSQAGTIEFINGDYKKAIVLYDKALVLFKKESRKKTILLPFISAIFYIPALFQDGLENLNNIFLLLKQTTKTNYEAVYRSFLAVAYAQKNDTAERNRILKQIKEDYNYELSNFFYLHAKYWSSASARSDEKQKLEKIINKAIKNNYNYFAYQGAVLLSKLNYKKEHFNEISKNIKAQTDIKTNLFEIVKKVEPWERIINSLISLNNPTQQTITGHERIAWLINIKHLSIQPKFQVINKNGKWSKGRNIAIKKLMNNELDCMSPQDKNISASIYSEKSDYWGSVDYYFDKTKAFYAMIGHPSLFLEDNPTVKIELVKASPELIVKQSNDSFSLEFSINCDKTGITIKKETQTKYKVIEITDSHKSIYQTFGQKKITIPSKAKGKLQKVISNLSSVLTIQSDLKYADDDIRSVKADSKIYTQLLPYNEGIKAELFVKPFKTASTYLKPGKGGKNIIAEVNNKKVKTSRNLSKETQNAKFVYSSCPELQSTSNYNSVYITEEPQEALQLLSELQNIKKDVVIEWPQGEKYTIRKEVSYDDMFMRIKHNTDWFEVSGELKIDNGLVFDLKQLLEILEDNKTNFIELKNGEFIALTEKFRNHLNELNSYSDRNKSSIRIHPLAAQAIDGLTENITQMETDNAWIEQKQRIEKAKTIKPKVPSTLQTELRDYQITGYNWLSQLAAWGVGACLADDMGLGKTIQAIALLLQRASDGFALVIAPASVARNWRAEIIKFAPTLNPILLRTGNRKEKLESLKEFDVLICTYGLLQSESEMLSEISWKTIILDEAQAIKNYNTKTSKAAMKLKADFKLITTGTPIQNHLGELWNLFNFINKGLLGTAKRFNERFVANTEEDARKKLKKLIQPFILRRTKTQVLEELPKKTEITLEIELSKHELAFYEAIRQKAIENLDSDDKPDSQKQFQILAEITKMRQACCHPQLVLANSKIQSSKVSVFMELLKDILDGNHKVLVFSQFVRFLTIMRSELEANNIEYKYLDGSTPVKKREQSIKEFQSGQGDVFLISLKAGGLGLNLTAADYVIHLDPWWNPAIEDQASDRAHRIGQKRPVTVYRLVTKGSIEEKIINLHKSKRQLADNLLAGTDVTGKLNAKQLLELIRK